MLRFLTVSRLALNPNLIFEIGSRFPKRIFKELLFFASSACPAVPRSSGRWYWGSSRRWYWGGSSEARVITGTSPALLDRLGGECKLTYLHSRAGTFSLADGLMA